MALIILHMLLRRNHKSHIENLYTSIQITQTWIQSNFGGGMHVYFFSADGVSPVGLDVFVTIIWSKGWFKQIERQARTLWKDGGSAELWGLWYFWRLEMLEFRHLSAEPLPVKTERCRWEGGVQDILTASIQEDHDILRNEKQKKLYAVLAMHCVEWQTLPALNVYDSLQLQRLECIGLRNGSSTEQESENGQEPSSRPQPHRRNFPVTPTPGTFSKYCRANGRRIAIQLFPFFKA